MKVLISGAGGQLGSELIATAPPSHDLVALGRAELDLTDERAVADVVAGHRPEVVINSAAFTAVDRAEQEREVAFAVNAEGAGRLAAAAEAAGSVLVQISTDYVFGDTAAHPRRPDDETAPLNAYGESKLEGERRVLAASGGGALVLRTAWLYSRYGANFVTNLLGTMRRGEPLLVVADQTGTPTWARGLARAVWRAVARGLTGVHHWTDAGVASWYDFAVAIQDEALELGLLEQPVVIRPRATADHPTAARRPAFSVLDKTATWEALGLEPTHWRHALRVMLGELGASCDDV